MSKALTVHSMRRIVACAESMDIPIHARLSAFDPGDDADTGAVVTKSTFPAHGVFDTGATRTVISTRVAEALALPVIDRVPGRSADGVAERTVHAVNLVLGDEIIFTGLPVICMPLPEDDLLVGMDIIGGGEFRISLRHDFWVVDFDLFVPTTSAE